MNPALIITILQDVVTYLPGAITTVEQLVQLGTKFYTSLNGVAPSQADVDALRTSILADVTLALSPLPDAQPGDPDYVKPSEG